MTAVAAAMLAAMAGCAGKQELKPVFWPAPPDLPRVQFLRSVKDSRDVMERKSFDLLSLGGDSATDIPIYKPYGVAVKHGKIYLTDTVAAEVLIIDLPGKKMSRLSGNKTVGKLKKPIGITVDDDGNIYVADTNRMEVLQYGPDGTFVRALGKSLDIRPTDIESEGEYLYLLDSGQSRILVLDRKSGELIRAIGQEGPDITRLSVPIGMAGDSKGGLYATNFNGRVIAYDRDGHFLKGFGKLGTAFGDFGRPRGIAADRDGLVYIVDAAMQHVLVFNDQFRILMFFGGPGTTASLNVPAGIAVSTDNLDYFQQLAEPDFIVEKVIYVVSQFGDRKVNIYGFGKKKGVDYDTEYKKILELVDKKTKAHEEQKKKEQAEKEKGGSGTGTDQPQPQGPK